MPHSKDVLVSGFAIVIAFAGCGGGGGGGCGDNDGSGGDTAGTTDSSTTMTITGVSTVPDTTADDTGVPGGCADDYDGNHDLQSAHALGLNTTDTARAVFGDQMLSGVGNEVGGDQLVVCPGVPDFFSVESVCPGYMGIDLRRLGAGEIDLYLYADGVEIDHAVGTWNDFFLKPLHRPVDAQTYTVEVRHAEGGAQPYSLEVYVLPTAPCP